MTLIFKDTQYRRHKNIKLAEKRFFMLQNFPDKVRKYISRDITKNCVIVSRDKPKKVRKCLSQQYIVYFYISKQF